jgi:hypothetical protein
VYIAKELSERKVRVAVRKYATLPSRRDACSDGGDDDDASEDEVDENLEAYSPTLILECKRSLKR